MPKPNDRTNEAPEAKAPKQRTAKEKKALKDFLLAHGHKAAQLDGEKWDDEAEEKAAIFKLHGVRP